MNEMGVCKPVTKSNLEDFLASYDDFMFDCDGVLWTGNDPIPGASDTIEKLRFMGKRIFYLTNNSTKTREEFLQKFSKLGFQASVDEVFSTPFEAARYLKDINFDKKVYVVGGEGMTKELDRVGIKHIGEGVDVVKGDVLNWISKVKLDPEVGAVLVGFDGNFSYAKMLKAASYINQKDCLFIAANIDEIFPPMNDEIVMPAPGCMVASIQVATNKEPLLVGKPSPYIFNVMAKEQNIDPSRAIMIGDRLNTDIMLGKNCNLGGTLVVLSGVTTAEEIERIQDCPHPDDVIPDYYLPSLAELGSLIDEYA